MVNCMNISMKQHGFIFCIGKDRLYLNVILFDTVKIYSMMMHIGLSKNRL